MNTDTHGDDFVLVVAPPASAPPDDDKDAIIAALHAEIRDLKAALDRATSDRYRTGDPLRLKGWDNR